MREEVVVHSGNAHYYPNFQNPTFLAAQKEVLRKELVLRIKMGNFEKLYPEIINSIKNYKKGTNNNKQR